MDNNKKIIAVLCVVIAFFLGTWFGGGRGFNRGGVMVMDHTMSMNSMMQSMNAGLIGKTGDAFDNAFLTEMIVHHQGAVEMAELVLKTSTRPELLTLARNIISAQNTEINQMKAWQNSWFGR